MNKTALAMLSLCALSAPALANTGSWGTCQPHTTAGAWVYTCEGTLPIPGPAQNATRILGRCTATLGGWFDCAGTVNLGGAIYPHTLKGQANNQPNCTGTISYEHWLNGGPAGQLDIQYVISEGGDAINGLPTNSGGVMSCSLKRIRKSYF